MGADDADQQVIASRLREARKTLGLSQEDVAGAIGIQRSAVSQLESGQRNVTGLELRRLSRLYRRSTAWLLGEPEPPDDPVLAEAVAHLCPQDREAVLGFARFLHAQARNGRS